MVISTPDKEDNSRNYDVLILGGGYGTRLSGPYNPKNYLPKGLIAVGGRVCIEHTLRAFSTRFFDRLILETNNEGVEPYSQWRQSYAEREKVEILLEPFSKPTACLGVLETIHNVWSSYQFSKPVLILAPDNLFSEKQDHLLEDKSEAQVRILTYEVRSLEDAKKYGVVELRDNRIVSCIEKPNNPSSKTIRTSAEVWYPGVFEHLHKWIQTGNTDKVGDFIMNLIEKDMLITACPTRGNWIDIGTKEDLEIARRTVK